MTQDEQELLDNYRTQKLQQAAAEQKATEAERLESAAGDKLFANQPLTPEESDIIQRAIAREMKNATAR